VRIKARLGSAFPAGPGFKRLSGSPKPVGPGKGPPDVARLTTLKQKPIPVGETGEDALNSKTGRDQLQQELA